MIHMLYLKQSRNTKTAKTHTELQDPHSDYQRDK